jgi:hypothetical protein
MEDAYFDIDLVRDHVVAETNEKETWFERCRRWANYDPILFVGCFAFATFLFVMIVFLIVWAIYNK